MDKTVFDSVIAIKGAGDLASGIACRLFNSNFCNIYLMEIEKPLAVRRLVSFAEAVYRGEINIEGITGVLAKSIEDLDIILNQGKIPVIVDPFWGVAKIKTPDVLIDAIMAKSNIGTSLNDANLVIGLGPGFEVGQDVDFVIETKRGHDLGRVIHFGMAQRNTSIPEKVGAFTYERVVRSYFRGRFKAKCQIGDKVIQGQVIGEVDGKPVIAKIDGILRGLIHQDVKIVENMKIADIDPRGHLMSCHTISDKARSLGGSVLEAIFCSYKNKKFQAEP